MRNLERKPYETLYAEAEKATKVFLYQLQNELCALAMLWRERKPETQAASIMVLDADGIKKTEGVYGSTPGLYLHVDAGDVAIYLPKTTLAYSNFINAIVELHECDDNLYYETVPYVIDVFYDGAETIEFNLWSNIVGLPIAEAYTSAKYIAEELVQMLSGIQVYHKIEYYEGDDNGNTDLNEDPNNYFVGVKLFCKFENMR